jgi:hypothetical protein
MVEAPLSFGLSCFAYSFFYDGPGKVNDGALLAIFGTLTSVWALAVVVFLLSIKRSHLYTFVSSETASQFVQRRFREAAGDDERRMTIFGCHISMWRSIMPEVRDWVHNNHAGWAERAWYTEDVKSKIPVDMLPVVSIVVMPTGTPTAIDLEADSDSNANLSNSARDAQPGS